MVIGADHRYKNLQAHAIAINSALKQFKEEQGKTGNGPPKSIFLPLIENLINFASRVVETPSVEALREDLKKIKSTLQTQANQQLQIAKTVNSLSRPAAASPPVTAPGARSYIDTLAKAQTNATDAAGESASSSSPPVQPALAKNLVIHVRKTADTMVNPLRRDNKALVDRVNKNIADTKDKIIAHRKVLAGSVLPSGSMILTADNLKNLERLIRTRSPWVKVLSPNATIKRRGYSIAVYGMDIGRINHESPAKQQKALAERIKAANTSCLAATPTEVTYVGWVRPWKTVTRESKPSILIVELDSSNAANALLRGGFVLDGKYFNTSYYDRDQQLLQYFRCQESNHIKQYCRRNRACAYCARSYKSIDCTFKNDKTHARCANCRLKHFAFNRICAKKKKRLKAVRQHRLDAPALYAELPVGGSNATASTAPADAIPVNTVPELSSKLAQSKSRRKSTTKPEAALVPAVEILAEVETSRGKRLKQRHEENNQKIIKIDIRSQSPSMGNAPAQTATQPAAASVRSLENIQNAVKVVNRYRSQRRNQFTVPDESSDDKLSALAPDATEPTETASNE
ncbi:uncharacterized protein BO66DRAFT_442220 [Aspergillus aculeatinus CBS 121060]|uniref:Uncharacterized protein n=1 Tax=Aspergillus aculeatinus CBS 121060 TaxID=1448322 RepID=A0ACD1GYP7_9EURO|nr:hypothetical protein BO66DRAFT_442220 [Aspergillus aculeatinus CBS 121060]RAH66424.1 hypothetical protein BO66DRAFT_442220 [Aspergillus aculeatinus CBS 121060]